MEDGMKRLFWALGGVAVILAALTGCQTAKGALIPPHASEIQAEKSGFAPAAAAGQNTMDLSLLFGNADAISTWRVELGSGGRPWKTWSGDAKYLPASLSWDGTGDAGKPAPEGTYTARLSVDYASKFASVSVESRSFVLDITPPTGSISMSPSQFTPTEKGVAGPVKLTINATSKVAHMDSWSLDVLDEAGALAKNWSGRWPDTSVTWDGSSLGGGFVMPSAAYRAAATVRDEYGNSAQIAADIRVAALASKPPVAVQPPKPGQPVITAASAGFSPNGDKVADSITLQLGYGRSSAVVSWKVTISAAGAGTQKTYSGNPSTMPMSLLWDGKADSGAMAPEGVYTAALSVDYGKAFIAGKADSQPFILDLTPPSGTISLSTPLFSPIESSDTITLKLAATSPLAKIDSWTMDIMDPGGSVFRSFTSKWPADTAVWDGKSTSGEFVQSAEDYSAVARVRDQFGIVGTVKGNIPVDILVEKTATGYRILSSRIFFKAFTADYTDVPPDLAHQNAQRLDALAAKLAKFPGYRINLVGHAVMINWDKPEAGREEQQEILIPLSKSRAEAVRAALVDHGLEAGRFSTEGVGASEQLVPDSDYKDRWQNRRVALFLEKQ
jgi:outer membrane protein OmpA-like peptidoglycan-associated protein